MEFVIAKSEFDWTREFRSHVLSAFHYGYAVVQIPGGRLAGQYGGKYVVGTGVLVSVVATVLTPAAARLQQYLVIALRIVIGAGSVRSASA